MRHCKCPTDCTECKCSRTNARSGHYFAARDSPITMKGRLSRQWPVRQCCFRSAGGASAHAERRGRVLLCRQWQVCRCSVRARLILVHTWPLQLGQCRVTCLGPRYSSPPHKLNMNSLLCNVKNWRLES